MVFIRLWLSHNFHPHTTQLRWVHDNLFFPFLKLICPSNQKLLGYELISLWPSTSAHLGLGEADPPEADNDPTPEPKDTGAAQEPPETDPTPDPGNESDSNPQVRGGNVWVVFFVLFPSKWDFAQDTHLPVATFGAIMKVQWLFAMWK